MDSRNFAIGILSTTAVMLLVGIMIIHSRPAPAIASGMTAASGDYVMTVGSVSSNDEELVFVIDNAGQKMLVYRFDIGRHEVQIVQGIKLGDLQQAAGAQAPSSNKRRRP